ncbi:MlaE family ABC transporter permease [Streptomyces sulphureus]|uniref:MlaE family ABC transporter permease n=1 Tax=Streptomyces sulphureus TaxID=47758 RepID=UPI0003749A67|nr:ABC transporter permease [Streptomyces sulphureus]
MTGPTEDKPDGGPSPENGPTSGRPEPGPAAKGDAEGSRPPALKQPLPGLGWLRQTGALFALAVAVLRAVFKRPFQFREFVEQFWFIASVTILPAALVSIPFGAVIALQVGSLASQISAQSFTGGASVLVNIQQASPLIVALLIAGAAGSAICADLGSRTIREELDAMEVMGVSPIQRLVVPRVLATICVAVLLNGMVSVVGTLGGYFFNVVMQDGTPGAYIASFSALAQLPDLYISEIKAALFGFIAGVVAAYRGLNPRGGPKGVGDAVNQSVVITFLLLFLVNLVLTGIYLQLVPPKGA